MVLPYKRLIWFTYFCLFSLGEIPTAFSMEEHLEKGLSSRKRSSSLPKLSLPLHLSEQLQRLQEVDGFIVIPQSSRKRAASVPPALRHEVSQLLKSQARQHHLQPTEESGSSFPEQQTRRVINLISSPPEVVRGPAPSFMRPETYLPPSAKENSFSFKRTFLLGGGLLLAASPFVWGPYLAAAVSSYYIFGAALGATELTAGVFIKSGITANTSPVTDSSSKDTKTSSSTAEETGKEKTA